MKNRAVLFAALLGSCAAPVPPDQPGHEGPIQELVGRSPGTPVKCTAVEQMGSMRISDSNRHLLLYGSGRTIFVNDLGPSCGFNRNDVIVTEPTGSFYCRGDLVRSFDRYSRIPGPACVLDNWVPYTR